MQRSAEAEIGEERHEYKIYFGEVFMIYCLDNDEIVQCEYKRSDNKEYLVILGCDEVKLQSSALGLHSKFLPECENKNVSRFESHDGFDFISLNVPDNSDEKKPENNVCIYLSDNMLLFVYDNYVLADNVFSELIDEGLKNISLGKILHMFMDKLTLDDSGKLESIEQEISDIEETLIISNKDDIIKDIIALRKRLFSLKNYYEQLLVITEEIEQNENELIDKRALKYFRMITSRVDRLYHNVLNLRDYVTQVREAYQAQIDINLNSIMKVFTVITSVFLPLTLIAGWYGMNLKMPEYSWEYSYPFVILISIIAAAVSLVYFKIKKWF